MTAWQIALIPVARWCMVTDRQDPRTVVMSEGADVRWISPGFR
ncbi:MAG: hypothetical protein ACOX3E_08525 [Desulfomonilia bacterium]